MNNKYHLISYSPNSSTKCMGATNIGEIRPDENGNIYLYIGLVLINGVPDFKSSFLRKSKTIPFKDIEIIEYKDRKDYKNGDKVYVPYPFTSTCSQENVGKILTINDLFDGHFSVEEDSRGIYYYEVIPYVQTYSII